MKYLGLALFLVGLAACGGKIAGQSDDDDDSPKAGTPSCADSVDQLNDRLRECVPGAGAGEATAPPECDARTAAELAGYAACFAAADCGAITGTDPEAAGEFTSCLQGTTPARPGGGGSGGRGGSSGRGGGDDGCEAAIDSITSRYESCGFEVEPSDGSEQCTAEEARYADAVAACVDAATCDALLGGDGPGAAAYLDCIDAATN